MNERSSEFADTMFSRGAMTIEQVLEELNIAKDGEFGDSEGVHLSHCGDTMTTGHGIVGTDSIRCAECGVEAEMFLSPHVNGGIVFNEEDVEALHGCEWIIISKGN